MLILRGYQEKLIDDTRQALRKFRAVLLTAPTGAGKTAITVFMMGEAASRGKRAWFLVHQNELLSQTSKALWKQKLEHGVVASGRALSKLPVQVCSVQTLVNRLHLLAPPDLIIIDECHRSAAATYQKIIANYPNALVVGLTATPQRTDGKGLSAMYDEIVYGPSIRQLIDAGFLCEYDVYAPPVELDLSQVKNQMGDYKKDQLEVAVDKPSITGDAVAHYKKIAYGKRCVVMCVSIKHAEHVRDQYLSAGIPAVSIEGGMTKKEREKAIKDLESLDAMVICNVQLLIEGVDIPGIEVVQWLRPTQSLIVFMQGNGRGLRPCEGKEKLIILDHVGNVARHGLPCEDREWSLEGKKKGKRSKQDEEQDIKIVTCKKCFHTFLPGPKLCPRCNAPIEYKQGRLIEEKAGELQKLEIAQVKKQARIEQGQSKTLKDLVALGMRRGMKKAPQWAAITTAARLKRKPTQADFNEAMRIYGELKR
jgi:DNA repair protein RadD